MQNILKNQNTYQIGVRKISAFGNPYLFTARRSDEKTGLYYYRHRYCEPRSGRFVGRDPLGGWKDEVNHGNAYPYCGNNAVNRTDALGLQSGEPKTNTKPGKAKPSSSEELPEAIRRFLLAHGNPVEEAIQEIIDAFMQDPNWYKGLPDCPCENPDLKGVKTNEGWASEGASHAHPGAAECFRSYPLQGVNKLMLDGPGQQCCYDACGKLITGGPGAGTPDQANSTKGEDGQGKVIHYWYGGIYHVLRDYVPFKILGWQLYNMLWPPNQGKDANGKPCQKNFK